MLRPLAIATQSPTKATKKAVGLKSTLESITSARPVQGPVEAPLAKAAREAKEGPAVLRQAEAVKRKERLKAAEGLAIRDVGRSVGKDKLKFDSIFGEVNVTMAPDIAARYQSGDPATKADILKMYHDQALEEGRKAGKEVVPRWKNSETAKSYELGRIMSPAMGLPRTPAELMTGQQAPTIPTDERFNYEPYTPGNTADVILDQLDKNKRFYSLGMYLRETRPELFQGTSNVIRGAAEGAYEALPVNPLLNFPAQFLESAADVSQPGASLGKTTMGAVGVGAALFPYAKGIGTASAMLKAGSKYGPALEAGLNAATREGIIGWSMLERNVRARDLANILEGTGAFASKAEKADFIKQIQKDAKEWASKNSKDSNEFLEQQDEFYKNLIRPSLDQASVPPVVGVPPGRATRGAANAIGGPQFQPVIRGGQPAEEFPPMFDTPLPSATDTRRTEALAGELAIPEGDRYQQLIPEFKLLETTDDDIENSVMDSFVQMVNQGVPQEEATQIAAQAAKFAQRSNNNVDANQWLKDNDIVVSMTASRFNKNGEGSFYYTFKDRKTKKTLTQVRVSDHALTDSGRNHPDGWAMDTSVDPDNYDLDLEAEEFAANRIAAIQGKPLPFPNYDKEARVFDEFDIDPETFLAKRETTPPLTPPLAKPRAKSDLPELTDTNVKVIQEPMRKGNLLPGRFAINKGLGNADKLVIGKTGWYMVEESPTRLVLINERTGDSIAYGINDAEGKYVFGVQGPIVDRMMADMKDRAIKFANENKTTPLTKDEISTALNQERAINRNELSRQFKQTLQNGDDAQGTLPNGDVISGKVSIVYDKNNNPVKFKIKGKLVDSIEPIGGFKNVEPNINRIEVSQAPTSKTSASSTFIDNLDTKIAQLEQETKGRMYSGIDPSQVQLYALKAFREVYRGGVQAFRAVKAVMGKDADDVEFYKAVSERLKEFLNRNKTELISRKAVTLSLQPGNEKTDIVDLVEAAIQEAGIDATKDAKKAIVEMASKMYIENAYTRPFGKVGPDRYKVSAEDLTQQAFRAEDGKVYVRLHPGYDTLNGGIYTTLGGRQIMLLGGSDYPLMDEMYGTVATSNKGKGSATALLKETKNTPLVLISLLKNDNLLNSPLGSSLFFEDMADLIAGLVKGADGKPIKITEQEIVTTLQKLFEGIGKDKWLKRRGPDGKLIDVDAKTITTLQDWQNLVQSTFDNGATFKEQLLKRDKRIKKAKEPGARVEVFTRPAEEIIDMASNPEQRFSQPGTVVSAIAVDPIVGSAEYFGVPDHVSFPHVQAGLGLGDTNHVSLIDLFPEEWQKYKGMAEGRYQKYLESTDAEKKAFDDAIRAAKSDKGTTVPEADIVEDELEKGILIGDRPDAKTVKENKLSVEQVKEAWGMQNSLPQPAHFITKVQKGNDKFELTERAIDLLTGKSNIKSDILPADVNAQGAINDQPGVGGKIRTAELVGGGRSRKEIGRTAEQIAELEQKNLSRTAQLEEKVVQSEARQAAGKQVRAAEKKLSELAEKPLKNIEKNQAKIAELKETIKSQKRSLGKNRQRGAYIPPTKEEIELLARTALDTVYRTGEKVVDTVKNMVRYLDLQEEDVNKIYDSIRGLDQEVGKEIPTVVGKDYRMAHQAPSSGNDFNKPLSDLTGLYPDDIYTNPKAYNWYGSYHPDDKKTVELIKKVKDNPDAEVTIYRAVPKGVTDINDGDWVTLSEKYAIEHGESNLNGEYDILQKKVRAGDVYSEGNSLNEWGYSPSIVEPPPTTQAKATVPPTDLPDLVATANRITEEVRKSVGLDGATKATPEQIADWTEEARKINTSKLMNDMMSGTGNLRPLSKAEELAVGARLSRALERYSAALDELRTTDTPSIELLDRIDSARNEIDEISKFSLAVGTEWGKSGVARQALIRADYTTAGVITRFRKQEKLVSKDSSMAVQATKQEMADAEEFARISREKDDKIAALEKKIEDLKAQGAKEAPKRRLELRRQKLESERDDILSQIMGIKSGEKKIPQPKMTGETGAINIADDVALFELYGKLAKNTIQRGALSLEDVYYYVSEVAKRAGHELTKQGMIDALDAQMLKNRRVGAKRATKAELRARQRLYREVERGATRNVAEREREIAAREVTRKAREEAIQIKKDEIAAKREAIRAERDAQKATSKAEADAYRAAAKKAREEARALAKQLREAKRKAKLDARQARRAELTEALGPIARDERKIANLKGRIEDYNRMIESGEFFASRALKEGDEGYELTHLQTQLEQLRYEAKVAKQNVDTIIDDLGQPAWKKVFKEVIELPRYMQLGLDAGALTRQGFDIALVSPTAWTKAAKRGFGAAIANPAKVARLEEEFMRDPEVLKAIANGLAIDGPSDMPEGFISKAAQKIPGYGRGERFHKTFQNFARYETYRNLTRGQNMNQYQLKETAKLINAMTGRGGWKIAEGKLASIFTAPKMYAGQLEVMGKTAKALVDRRFYDNPAYRKLIVRRWLGRMGGLVALKALADATDWEFSINPDDSDFLKLRNGNTVIDVTGGYSSWYKLLFSTLNDVAESGMSEGFTDKLVRSLGYKVSPTVRTPLSFITGKDAIGKPFFTNPDTGEREMNVQDLAKTFAPLIGMQIYEMAGGDEGYADMDGGAKVALGGLGFIGTGVSNYEPRDPSRKPEDTKWGQFLESVGVQPR